MVLGSRRRQGLAVGVLTLALSGCVATRPDEPGGQRDLRLAETSLRRAERTRGADQAVLLAYSLRAFQRALAADPLLFQAHLGLGRCHYLLGEYALELGEYRKCVAVNPSCADGWMALGNTLHCRMELVEARAAYRRAIQLLGDRLADRAGVLYDLALVERDLGHASGAEACLLQALPMADQGLEPRVRQRLAELEVSEPMPELGPR